MIGDMPSVSTSTYGASTSAFNLAALGAGDLVGVAQGGLGVGNAAAAMRGAPAFHHALIEVPPVKNREEQPMAASRRLVKVIIVDPNENVPLADCVLFSGPEKLTDATDQELFFEIDMKTILAMHNEKRVKVIDKKVKERTEHLEPVKIRELKMVVVEIAKF